LCQDLLILIVCGIIEILISVITIRFDFDSDGRVTKEDIRFLLTYIPLI